MATAPLKKKITLAPMAKLGADMSKVSAFNTATMQYQAPASPKSPPKSSAAPKSPPKSPVKSASQATCPPGCVPLAEMNRRIRDALQHHGSKGVPTHAPGMEKYEKKLDAMEKAYKHIGKLDEDEDIAFDLSSKATKKKSAKKKTSACEKYSGKPLKCLAKGCKYSDKTKKCYGAPKIAKNKVSPAKKQASPKLSKSQQKLRKQGRERALQNGHLSFTIDGYTYRRPNINSKTFVFKSA